MATSKTIITDITSIPETVKWIKKLTIQASKDPRVQQMAEQCLKSSQPLQCVFDTAYDAMTYMPDEIECNNCGWLGVKADKVYSTKVDYKLFCPACQSSNLKLKQQLRTIDNILRDHKGNCTHYAILIGGMLINMKIGFKDRVVGYDKPNKYDHIYVVTDSGIILDPVQGQKQDGTDTKFNRPVKGKFNKEVKYRYKLDYPMPNLEILQGTLGCDQAFAPIVKNRSSAARLGLISGYVGCSVVGGVMEGVDTILGGKKSAAKKVARQEKHAVAKSKRVDSRLVKKDKKATNKTAHKIQVISARQKGNTTAPEDGGGQPVNADNVTDRLNTFMQNSGFSMPGSNTGSNTGISNYLPVVQDQEEQIPGNPPPDDDDDKILGMDKTTAIIVGLLATAGVGYMVMGGKKGKGKK